MYKNLRQALLDLEKAGMLKRIREEVDPYLQMAEMARQAYDCHGPALLFEKVKGCRFQAACNIFGTEERMNFLFRDTLESTRTAVQFKSNPVEFFRHATPASLMRAMTAGIRALPQKGGRLRDFEECSLEDLPQIVGWPEDGGAFVTLPQVASRPGERARILKTNLGMYRVQISGNEYAPDECGLHYQIKRDIARHHQKAIEEGRPLKVSVFIGGPPAHSVAAVMPMPENLSELVFAGMLGGRRFRYFEHEGYLVSSDAEFCILGEMAPDLKPEGPFGDHVGYYSGKHPFPYLKVKKVLCKKNAIYPFTAVGRPPKEDTAFGNFIHEITRPMVPASLPGVEAVHAVDAAGVHPLCLATASERFIPYARPEDREPLELLKTANALLGFNQVSLTKYLILAAREDGNEPENGGRGIPEGNAKAGETSPKGIPAVKGAKAETGRHAPDGIAPDVNDIPAFLAHVLERIDFSRDLHFQTSTSIDTLDYTGTSLNHGSKLVIAVAGQKKRELRDEPADLDTLELPAGFDEPRIAMAGTIAVRWKPAGTNDGAGSMTAGNAGSVTAGNAGNEFAGNARAYFTPEPPTRTDIEKLKESLSRWKFRAGYPWVSIVNDTSTIGNAPAGKSLDDFLWMTFTRSDPAQDTYGLDEKFVQKHWAISPPLIIDATIKPRHQKPLSISDSVKDAARMALQRAGISADPGEGRDLHKAENTDTTGEPAQAPNQKENRNAP